MGGINTVVIVSIISFSLSLLAGGCFYFKRHLFITSVNSNFVSNANVAAAGVLISMGLHHILCEALVDLTETLEADIDKLKLLKICTFIFFSGFMFMFIAEKICIRYKHDEHFEKYIVSGAPITALDMEMAEKKKNDDVRNKKHGHGSANRRTKKLVLDERSEKTIEESENEDDDMSSYSESLDSISESYSKRQRNSSNSGFKIAPFISTVDVNNSTNDDSESDDEPYMSDMKQYMSKKYRSELFTQVLIFISLCLHSVVAGVGSSFNKGSQTAMAFVMISFMLHKIMDVAIVAKGLLELHVRRIVYVLFVFTFAFMTPVGMMLGAYIRARELDKNGLVFVYFLQLFTGGIFVYIAIIDIFIEHFIDKGHKWSKLGIFMTFYITVSIIAYVD